MVCFEPLGSRHEIQAVLQAQLKAFVLSLRFGGILDAPLLLKGGFPDATDVIIFCNDKKRLKPTPLTENE